jgi:heme exporter protein D
VSFESFGDFVAMRGHGLYVWLAYGVTAVALAVNLINLARARQRAFAAAARGRQRAP